MEPGIGFLAFSSQVFEQQTRPFHLEIWSLTWCCFMTVFFDFRSRSFKQLNRQMIKVRIIPFLPPLTVIDIGLFL